jgi:hypothetical protein
MWDDTSEQYWTLEVHPDLLRWNAIGVLAQLNSEVSSLTGLGHIPPGTPPSSPYGRGFAEEPSPPI